METDDVLDLMRSTAAEIITPRFRALADGEVIEKRPGDLVTIADREAELAITPALQRAYPDAMILGEEAAEADPALLDAFAVAEHSFTIDPVDGTHNFVMGNTDHAVMLAELRFGEVVRGWILLPAYDRAYVAEKGAGAWCDGERLPSLTPSADPAAWRGIGSTPQLQTGEYPPLAQVQPTWNCAGVDYANLANGTVDYVVLNHAKPWDHAPGSLLVAEAGGTTIRWDGSAYLPADTRPGLISGASVSVAGTVRNAVLEVLLASREGGQHIDDGAGPDPSAVVVGT